LKKYATAPPKFSRSFYSLFGICGICPKKKEGQSGISLPLPDFSPSFALTKRPFVLYNKVEKVFSHSMLIKGGVSPRKENGYVEAFVDQAP
jgi:hypothetical protein